MTEQMYFRDGAPVQGHKIVSRKSGFGVIMPAPCGRCGGAGGSDKWAHTGWKCFDCGGAGTIKNYCAPVYSADKLAKLNAAKAKADAKRAAIRAAKEAQAQADADARRDEFVHQNADFLSTARAFVATGRAPDFVSSILESADARAALSLRQVEAIEAAIARDAAHQRRIEESVFLPTEQRFEFVATVRRRDVHRGKFGSECLVMLESDRGLLLYRGSAGFAPKGSRVAFVAKVEKNITLKSGERCNVIKRPTKVDVQFYAPAES